ncbi:hypothetical protein N431DRAFT_463579 [Stipitochalara longipes BDJ]|nr:hypothetical protein N431DRAFT_463579 [Stipitochalara longipes BDJ]
MKFQCLLFALLAQYTVASNAGRDDGAGNFIGSPCAIVSQSSKVAAATAFYAIPTVDAQLAYDCLTSVPLNIAAAVDLVSSILPYLQWQSDLSYLKHPPPGYMEPAIDIHANLTLILNNIKDGNYKNEHEFQTHLFKTFQAVHDGHFRFSPDLLSKVFAFRRPVEIVSVSKDGTGIPKVYTKEDIIIYNSGNWTPSALTRINGQQVNIFLEDLAQLGFLQDPDALYNNLMFEMAFDAESIQKRYTGMFALAGRFGYFYPGPNTTIEFENGTMNTYYNYAEIVGDFTGISDGLAIFQKFCTGPHQNTPLGQEKTPKAPTPPPTALIPAYGYPNPHVITVDQQLSGYFLDGPGYTDVAVLSILSFEPTFPVQFQTAIQTFISDAMAAGKTKMVIDLSGNGGGDILLGYDLFRQFFPQIVQDGFTRMREHEAFNIASKGISQYSANFSTTALSSVDYLAYQSPLNFRYDLNVTNKPFSTYEDKFKPQQFNGDNFTQLMRWNLDDNSTTVNSVWGLGATITGYGNRRNFTQPFDAKDIIMIYDGFCASTCGIFSEFMRLQGGVKSIAMGGRPSKSAIQGIGGTKGANNYPFAYIRQITGLAISTISADQTYNGIAAPMYSDLPTNRSTDTSLNVRDNILRDNLEDGIPAQFVYEAADCRLYYEPSMITNVTAIWRKAADAAWGAGKCVSGSLPHANEILRLRKMKSEAMKHRAKLEGKPSMHKRDLVLLLKSPVHGKKVPWA